MFARIRFEHGQNVTPNKLKELEETLCDKVEAHDCVCVVETSKITPFSSWEHTYDENDENKNKSLVLKSEMVQLSTSREYIVELNSFLTKFPEININLRGTMQGSKSQMADMIDMMVAAEEKFTNALASFNEKIEFNSKCNVHIGNLGLLSINQLAYANDKCTEELQDLINEGWRILAVCPQPDQRRPDYILGRYNENQQSDMYCTQF